MREVVSVEERVSIWVDRAVSVGRMEPFDVVGRVVEMPMAVSSAERRSENVDTASIVEGALSGGSIRAASRWPPFRDCCDLLFCVRPSVLLLAGACSPSSVWFNFAKSSSTIAESSPVASVLSSLSRCSSSIFSASASLRSRTSLLDRDSSSLPLEPSVSDVCLCLCRRLLLLILYDLRSVPMRSEKSTSLASTTARSKRRLASSRSRC